jgi:hypothetical protein
VVEGGRELLLLAGVIAAAAAAAPTKFIPVKFNVRFLEHVNIKSLSINYVLFPLFTCVVPCGVLSK